MGKKESKELKKGKKTEPHKSIKENKYLVFGLLAAFLVLVFCVSSYKIYWEDDFFWHLTVGRYIVENKIVPDKDVFGYVTQGTKWIPFEWGWDILSYGLYNIGGINAILVFRSLAFCLIFFLYFMLLRKFKFNSFISIIMLLALLVAVMDRLSARPHIITYIFFIITLYILLNFKYFDRIKYSKWLYFLPLIFLVWSNFHMGVIAGGLLLFIFVIAETIIYLKPRRFSAAEVKPLTKAEIKKLWIISILCALALLINPHGMNTYIYVYGHTKMKMMEDIYEWQGPFSGKADTGITLTLYKTFLFLGILVLMYAYKKRDLTFALITIGFAVYSVRAIRFSVDYEIVMLFFIAVSINYYIGNIAKGNVRLRSFLNGNILKSAFIVFIIYIITQFPSNNAYTWLGNYRVFGWGIDKDYMPVELIDFMRENNVSGNPYNSYETGGYLIWNFPQQKNFIDSRGLNDEIFNEYSSILTMRPGFEKKLENRGVDYVIYFDPEVVTRLNSLKSLVINYFSRNPGWKLVFWDDKSMLFLKNIPKFADLISKFEYKIIHPYTALFHKQEFNNNVKLNPQTAREELNRKAQTEPNGHLFKNINHEVSVILQGL